MYRIDELITEIHKDETIDIPGELTKEQIQRIETYINGKKRVTYRKRTTILLVATMVLVMGFTVLAAKKNEWDITLMNFMGLNESSMLQLEGGEVIIQETTKGTSVDNPFSITEIISIGDKNSAYLRVNTDYELPKSFDETTDYILPENHRMDITYNHIFGWKETRTFASTFTSFYEDGKLGFLISIENCKELNKCNVNLKIENLYWYHDLGQNEETSDAEPEELLAEGTWEKEWTYSYKSNVRTEYVLKKVQTEEGELYLTKIEISPISIRMEAIRHPKDRDLPWTIDMLEEIQYEDGTVICINNTGSGGIGNGISIEEFTNVYYLGEVLQPEKVKCIKVCGQNIDI